MTEDQLEKDALEWLIEAGYTHLSGYDIAPDGPAPEHKCFRSVLLPHCLRSAINRLNPDVSLADLLRVGGTGETAHVRGFPSSGQGVEQR
jgi:hypothetical protein